MAFRLAKMKETQPLSFIYILILQRYIFCKKLYELLQMGGEDVAILSKFLIFLIMAEKYVFSY